MRKVYAIPIIAVVLTALVWLSCGRQGPVAPPGPTSFDRLQTNLTQHSNSLESKAGSIDFCQANAAATQEANRAAKPVVLNNTVFNTDFVSAGVSKMRDIGNGTITLGGVTGPVTKAYLYWHGPTNSSTDTGNPITVNGNPVTGTNIGYSSDNCWGYANSQAYRADVTALVQATGNGTYALSNFGGMNPNGASLVVYFNDGNSTNNRDVVVFEGNDSNISFPGISGNPLAPPDPSGWNVTLSGINYTSGTASIQLHVGDGQLWTDDNLVLNNQILAPGPQIFDGTSVPPGNDNFLGLWDIKNFDVTSFLSPGPNTLTLTTGVVSDCLALIVALVDLPAGSAPKPTTVCPLTQGFWKNHPDVWPVNSLTLGSQSYTQAELLTLLKTPVGGKGGADASLSLAHQLIAAKLNVANGSDPAPIASTITAADNLLSAFSGKLPYGVKPSSTTGQAMTSAAKTLDDYNNGLLTPDCE